ncbi:MAG: NAD(P)/FAD-dependent oxidoreductase [Candidatus Thermoplasmatota archaeon]|jgi:flavin-dependent dehydrogenase|nr:NAD(P)/FAD-dependent oxidoreductase [Candidatus Thermoplasmatota archaeon]MCL5785986.1 NAD(P)/FAD-dependent oxidoreductase [Candidatus Thermoplasmatota archaeon]
MRDGGEYDIIVAGAGIAGTLAAAMASRKGKRVILLDRNPEAQVGKKTIWGWTCGDAVAGSHIDFVKKKMSVTFGEPELDRRVDGVYALSPDLETKFKFEGVGYTLDRPEFEAKLLKIAKGSGSEYVSEFEVQGPILEDRRVVGVFGRDKSKEEIRYRSKVVIDTLGISTVLRRNLPDNPFVDRTIDIDDVESTGRYIYEFDLDHEDLAYYDRENALIHLNNMMAPGGYGWVFPKSGNRINVGIGVQKKSLDIRNTKLGKKDNLQTLIDEYVKWNPLFKNLRIWNKNNNGKGSWSVAVRRPIESMVFDGYMGAGDSMALPNPISAGGIGPAMLSGVLAGENAAKAIEANDTSTEGMWQYNLDYNQAYGKKMAGMEVFRIYLQSLNNDILNYGMRTFLSTKEASDITLGIVPELSLASKFKMVLKGTRNISAFSNLVHVMGRMKTLNQMYENYPASVKEFAPFKKQVVHMIEEAKERFPSSPI